MRTLHAACIGLLCSTLACALSASVAEDAGRAAPEPDAFETWSTLASAESVSPARAAEGDFVRQWRGPDGREIRLVVKRPRPAADAPVVRLPPVPDGEDAQPYFQRALAEVRERKAGRLLIPRGTYVFKSLAEKNAPGHLLLRDLSDLSIEGDGATLVFTRDLHGLFLQRARRVRLSGVTLDYALRTVSVARAERRDGENVLVIDPRYLVTGADAVRYVSEYDAAAQRWVPGGKRVLLPPGHADSARYLGEQAWASPAFKTLQPGQRYTVFHHWYGGQAIRIEDVPGPQQSEDIVIEGVTIHSAPGMGILAYGLRRGLAIVDSRIEPRADGSSPVSTSYDAIHVQLGGGDVLIAGNRIRRQGDDGINLNNPVSPVVRSEDGGRALVLGAYSRFIRQGDMLAFFDGQGQLSEQVRVGEAPKPLGGLDHRVVLERPVDVASGSTVRDLALLSARFDVSGNTIEDCHCHGLLAQWPNGRIEGNTFRHLRANAIRLLTDVGQWKEGIGAFNVSVRGNEFTDIGLDTAPLLPWGAITVYGGARGGRLATEPVNRHIEIVDNRIRGAEQGCVTVASARDVRVEGNRCEATNRQSPGKPSLQVLQAGEVVLRGNRREGKSSGGLRVESTAAGVSAQVDY
ncbi:right-handed parallel beta-helix repeat-containing protein [Azohydromonas caseinilytica]|uniref:Right-handed parallel beta-helix repeat-containing protein n=1 Tax=Azohydromonas caseinilytica TaxID=2728836 RepID=A0A848FEE4_9BURK|nr:right-handed parallel beta-helix repeat-containing protein [Azohydromonas caseinilytica]NML17778.1 right-handed parallel beta-helix repeat-containing protein [Azohydromonas caseinilytica]